MYGVAAVSTVGLTGCAREFVFSVPAAVSDLYQLHQMVWSQVDFLRDVRARPTILYRRDRGMLRVRVSGVAMRHGQSVIIHPDVGEVVDLKIRAALWRRVGPSDGAARTRAGELLSAAGLEPIAMTVTTSVAEGYKARAGELIRLAVADVQAKCKVTDAAKAIDAWRCGIGRGRRFGFGMIVL